MATALSMGSMYYRSRRGTGAIPLGDHRAVQISFDGGRVSVPRHRLLEPPVNWGAPTLDGHQSCATNGTRYTPKRSGCCRVQTAATARKKGGLLLVLHRARCRRSICGGTVIMNPTPRQTTQRRFTLVGSSEAWSRPLPRHAPQRLTTLSGGPTSVGSSWSSSIRGPNPTPISTLGLIAPPISRPHERPTVGAGRGASAISLESMAAYRASPPVASCGC